MRDVGNIIATRPLEARRGVLIQPRTLRGRVEFAKR